MKNILFIIMMIVGGIQGVCQSFTASYDHSALAVSDLETSAHFYHTVLNLEEIATPGDNPILRWFSLGNNHQLHLIKSDDKGLKLNKSIHLSLHVDDFDALLNSLKKKNIPYSSWLGENSTISTRPDGVHQVYIQDPDGYWIELNDASYDP